MNNLLAAIDAFTNPDSVWYYVVGVVFLILIFAALAVYIVVSNKKKKAQGGSAENAEATGDGAEENKIPEEADAPEKDTAEEQPEETKAEGEEPAPAEETKTEADEPTATDKAEEQAADEPKAKAKDKDAQPNIKIVEKKSAPKKSATTEKKAEPAEKSAAKPAAKKSAPKKTATAKPFIDRLLAAKATYGVYNEIKNTVLSYPGIKAKLTKDDEQFIYVDKKMAAVALDGESITLYLALDKTAVPSGFDVQAADGDFGIKMTVAETDIDSARKLIVFAMNVSMLTRNDKKRYVDYIQKAKDAKQRAQKK